MLRYSIVAAVTAAALLWAHPADACAGPVSCMDGMSLSASSVPANAEALYLRTQYFSEYLDAGVASTQPTGTAPVLLYADGGVVPATAEAIPGAWLLRPDEPLQADAGYALAFDDFCQWPNSTPPDGGTQVVPFSVGPAAPAPEQVATITPQAAVIVDRGPGDSCGGPSGVHAWVPLQITPSTDMVPWLPLARWTLVADGTPWAAAPFGRLETSTVGPASMIWNRTIFSVHGVCPGSDGGSDPGLTPGVHMVKLVAEIAGQDASYASAEVPVEIGCPGADAGGLREASRVDIDADRGSGCGATGGGAISFAAMWMLVALRRTRR